VEASSPLPPGVQRTNPLGTAAIPPGRAAMPAQAAQLLYARRLAFLVDVVSARVLALLGLMGGIAVFGYAIYDPSNIRAVIAALYAAGVLWPLVMLYWRTDKQPQPD
jgi:hypothetical protein